MPTGAADKAICCIEERRPPGATASFTAILLSERTREVRAAMISPMSIPRCIWGRARSGLSLAGSRGPARSRG
jgi:hypothetical protein